MRLLPWLVVLTAWLLPGARPVRAEIAAEAGPYRVHLRTDPSLIVVGKASVLLRITDAGGAPAGGLGVRVLAKMPDMDMGEREAVASPDPTRPGYYRAPAAFAMEGGYVVRIRIEGSAGEATATVPVRTGQETGGEAGAPGSGTGLLPWAVGAVVLLLVAYRLRRLGVRPQWRSLFRAEVLAGAVLVALAAGGSLWAVRTFRRPNTMSLFEALGGDMSSMPPPPGTHPVMLADVEAGPVTAAVTYTGSAVADVEEDVISRIPGWIEWLPFYAGDRVEKGQLLVRLDAREVRAQAERMGAELTAAREGREIARSELRRDQADVERARAEAAAREGSLEEAGRLHRRALAMRSGAAAGVDETRGDLAAAEADARAAGQERLEAESALQSARAVLPEVEAMLAATLADRDYWRAEIARMRRLFERGAVSGEELQRKEAEAKGAEARVRQSEARVTAVKSDIRGAQARLERALAVADAARSRTAAAQARLRRSEASVDEAEAEVEAQAARVATARAEAAAARSEVERLAEVSHAGSRRIRQAGAAVTGAAAGLTASRVVESYTLIRALEGGVVTERVLSPGVQVSPGQVILRVARIDPIRLQANVAEADLVRLRVGGWVEARNPTGGRLSGRITSIAPALDPVTRTGIVEAVVRNPRRLFLPGQSVRMTLRLPGSRPAGGLRVPASAVQWESRATSAVMAADRRAFVWKAQPGQDGALAVSRTPVRIGPGDGRYVPVLSGLEAGEQVVVRGMSGLREGDPVIAVEWEADGPGGLAPPPAEGGASGHSGHAGH